MSKILNKCPLFLGFIFLSTSFIFAQKSQPSTLKALRISEAIIVDGDLDEEAWDEADEISNFKQRELNEGKPATEETNVKILYNGEYLYIGVEANDSEADKITATASKRDFNWGSDDNIEIILGPFNNNRDAYLFVVNPNNAIADAIVTDDGKGFNKDWNGVWEAKVAIDEDEGWEAEIAIPFSTLKFPGGNEQVWALNIERNIRRKNEQVLWQGWSRDYNLENISQAGKLIGLSAISTVKSWEFKPYVTAGFADEKAQRVKGKFRVGGDINYLISPKMKLNFTVNTDFSQVESDREQINLSRFSLLFPEKRDFFLEGKKLFEFNLGDGAQTFYSRRIGLTGDEEERKEVPIIAGARLVGKTAKTNIGLMSMQTSAQDSLPSTNFSVLRVKQEIWQQSDIGFIMTSRYDNENYNFLYGIDFNYATSQLFDDKNLKMGLAFSQSSTENKNNKSALGYNAYIEYPNDFAEFYLGTSRISKEFNPRVGFLQRKNYKLISALLQLNPRPGFLPYVKNLEFIPFDLQYYLTDDNNELESFEYELRPLAVEFRSGDLIEFNIQRFFERFDTPFELFDEQFIPQGEYWFSRYEIGIETFEGRALFAEAQMSWGDYYSGKGKEIEAIAGLNITSQFNLSADWERNIIHLRAKSITTDEFGSRIEYALNPQLYSSLFAQWNNEDDEALLNFRITWLPRSGSYFYFVVNQEFNTDGLLAVTNTTVLSKLTWFFNY